MKWYKVILFAALLFIMMNITAYAEGETLFKPATISRQELDNYIKEQLYRNYQVNSIETLQLNDSNYKKIEVGKTGNDYGKKMIVRFLVIEVPRSGIVTLEAVGSKNMKLSKELYYPKKGYGNKIYLASKDTALRQVEFEEINAENDYTDYLKKGYYVFAISSVSNEIEGKIGVNLKAKFNPLNTNENEKNKREETIEKMQRINIPAVKRGTVGFDQYLGNTQSIDSTDTFLFSSPRDGKIYFNIKFRNDAFLKPYLYEYDKKSGEVKKEKEFKFFVSLHEINEKGRISSSILKKEKINPSETKMLTLDVQKNKKYALRILSQAVAGDVGEVYYEIVSSFNRNINQIQVQPKPQPNINDQPVVENKGNSKGYSVSGYKFVQSDKRRGFINQDKATLILNGDVHTNGKLVNGKYDGNGIESVELFDVRNKSIYSSYSVHGAKYSAFYGVYVDKLPAVTPLITTHHSWAKSIKVDEGTRIYKRITYTDHTWEMVLAKGNYDDQGGIVIGKNSGKLTPEQIKNIKEKQKIKYLFVDNYGGRSNRMKIYELLIVSNDINMNKNNY